MNTSYLDKTHPDAKDLHSIVYQFLIENPELIDPPVLQLQIPGQDYPSYEKWKNLSKQLQGQEAIKDEAKLYNLVKSSKLGTMICIIFPKFYLDIIE